MPTTCVHATCCHSLHIVVHAMLNLLVTLTMAPLCDRIPSTTPGAEPPRDARDPGSARSYSTHLETSSSNRP